MTVSWTDVARKDFEDAVRSKLLWGLTAAFTGLLGFFIVVAHVLGDGDPEPVQAFRFVGQFALFFVPLLALIAGYMAIVGERRSGSLRVLMSYPFSRGEVVAGKVVGRSVVVATTVLVGFGVAAVLAVALTGSLPGVEVLGIVLVSVLLGATFTALAVGISAGTSSRGTAMAWAIGLFFALFVLWDALAAGVYYVASGARPGLVVEPWYLLLKQANPMEAYRIALTELSDSYVSSIVHLGVEDIPQDTPPTDRRVGARVEGSVPIYLQPWFTGVTFLAWAVVPLAIGYRRFHSADLE